MECITLATTKPRITITLEPEVYETLAGLAEVQGRPMSSIVSELLTMADPVQRKVLEALRNVSTLQAESKAAIASQLDHAQEQVEATMGPLLALLEGFASASQPPHSNTGVTTPNPPATPNQKNPAKRRSRASDGESRP